MSESRYLRQAQRYLRWVVEGLRTTDKPLDLATIVAHFGLADLELLSRHMNGRGNALAHYGRVPARRR